MSGSFEHPAESMTAIWLDVGPIGKSNFETHH